MAESLTEEAPLSLELQSLRASVRRFQDEAHSSAVKLQRHSLDAVRNRERVVLLERENDVLKAELAILRANPQPDGQTSPADSQYQVQELSLSLRRLSQRLSLTEEALLATKTELAAAHAAALKASANAENAYELGARVRGREEEALVRQRDLEQRIKKLEEELRMSDLVVQEYAALVRSMQTRSSSDANPLNLQGTLKEGKLRLDHLFSGIQVECDTLARKLEEKSAELEVCNSKLDAERKANEAVLAELGRTQTELSKLQLEDGTAAKMVSHYMHTSTNKLLNTLNALQSRHASTVSTLSSQNHTLSTQLRSLESQNERVLSALDELGGEIMKEAYGRRREIAQRIRMTAREERVVEGLRRWIRRGDEMLSRLHDRKAELHNSQKYREALLEMAQHARILLDSLDNGIFDVETALSFSGGRARKVLVRIGLDGLLEELSNETERRLLLERMMATDGFNITVSENTDRSTMRDPQVLQKPLLPHNVKNLPTPPLPMPPVVVNDSEIASSRSSQSFGIQADMSEFPGVESSKQCNSILGPPSRSSTDSLQKVTQSPDVIEDALTIPTIDQEMHTANDMFALDDKFIEVRENVLDIATLAKDDQNTDIFEAHTESVDDLTITSSPSSIHSASVSTLTHKIPSSPPSVKVSDITSTSEPHTALKLHPMLAELAKVHKRYDDLQCAFRDCHFALEDLKASLSFTFSTKNGYPTAVAFGHNPSTSSVLSPLNTPIPFPNSISIPEEILLAALGRLDDYTEDTRVELEIRVGDETLLAKGFEALLSVPGALLEHQQGEEQPLDTHGMFESQKDSDLLPKQSEVEKQIKAFVDGTDPAVRRARDIFARKLEDVQHDIAVLKKAIHDPESMQTHDSFANSESSPSSLVSLHAEHDNGWTTWIRGPSSRSSSPAPVTASLGPSPTFGSIMTSPRLRSPSSTGNFHQSTVQKNSTRSRKSSFLGLGLGDATEQIKDPLSMLGLKVPMPSFASPALVVPSAHFTGANSSGYGKMTISSMSPVVSTPRTRATSSTIYMLGLGSSSPMIPGQSTGPRILRSPSGPPGSLLLHRQHVSQPQILSPQIQQGTETQSHFSSTNEQLIVTANDEEEDEEEDGVE
ncbi:hypothetical protein JR316_0004785 [Psilocybe cubensis]|uniref:Uncharacterized protein n=2 Tax=Psilocybe cubensis TaxID=181762 RepID=A0ACB8H4P8_PSICU|nr:hypothetical protein JR316_0004785 [Psilocybe cubensis]KAH9482685.1 hypothetical protein JR316_0004785 [Psilocybe cubensis]